MVALRLGLLRCHGAGTAVGVTFELWLAQVTGPGVVESGVIAARVV